MMLTFLIQMKCVARNFQKWVCQVAMRVAPPPLPWPFYRFWLTLCSLHINDYDFVCRQFYDYGRDVIVMYHLWSQFAEMYPCEN